MNKGHQESFFNYLNLGGKVADFSEFVFACCIDIDSWNSQERKSFNTNLSIMHELCSNVWLDALPKYMTVHVPSPSHSDTWSNSRGHFWVTCTSPTSVSIQVFMCNHSYENVFYMYLQAQFLKERLICTKTYLKQRHNVTRKWPVLHTKQPDRLRIRCMYCYWTRKPDLIIHVFITSTLYLWKQQSKVSISCIVSRYGIHLSHTCHQAW